MDDELERVAERGEGVEITGRGTENMRGLWRGWAVGVWVRGEGGPTGEQEI